MASFSDARKSSGQKSMETLERTLPLFGGSTNLYEALVGYNDDKGKWVRGVKLTFYVEGLVVKCAINDPVSNKVGFITLNPGMDLANAIEEALDPAGIEWRNPRGK